MSELFDSLNLSTYAGPSSSQQSSSQPSTSKVFWHASPSPSVLRHLANWTPSKSQDSPTLPLCTQAFVGELKKLPGAYEAQSPLISAKTRKLVDASRATVRHVSDPTPNRAKAREYINLDDDDDQDEQNSAPRRLLLGEVGESSPESARRRTMDAGNTGRMRPQSSPSQHSSTSGQIALLRFNKKEPQQQTAPHRRSDRRPLRRRKKESLIAGLNLTDQSGRATDCLKLFEDLQAAIQGMQSASRPSTTESTETAPRVVDQRSTAMFDRSSSAGAEGDRLTIREGINRTTSAPNTLRAAHHSQHEQRRSSQQQQHESTHTVRDEDLTPRRGLRAVKSDHDVFRPAGHADSIETRALQPRPTNVLSAPRADLQVQSDMRSIKAPAELSDLDAVSRYGQPRAPVQSRAKPATATATATTLAQPSAVKRSARIEAMQQTTNGSGKKLGVRAPSMLCKPVSPYGNAASSPTGALSRRPGGSTRVGRTRTLPLGKMSQARQPGLARSCSQSISASQHSPAAGGSSSCGGHGGIGPAAPFRPPAIAGKPATPAVASKVISCSPVKRSRNAGPASSDDSFGDVDDDAAFLALACEFEY
ncbi:uncharacterized protein UMAG_00161 [Mycosarcoma maydis]|uniref:Uncharacterized protein n=1 Tax=Mycosarcoma maydis TaxID=5270 RepID=A0A0D1CZN0_MYCMD|nr:uncharacterized protein UMAG_00161 [Ustilago maydis 521]KIS71723.1 hypothetical protein UMAG_00161 [Ustilago maydis 521]|eukprot:XP_011386108.1 hypothetical protein UMAG_00161 [Ustilago maydis 521]